MKNYRYDGTKSFNIKSFDCGDTGEFKERHEAIDEFVDNLEKINEYQQKLFAEQKEGIIFVFQAMDAAGKDGAVRAVLSCLSPQGVSEHSFKVPSSEENRHDFLWRFWDALPEKGSISIFNRSYYEDVLVQKVHKIYEKNKFADRIDMDTVIDKRYEHIRNFEKYLWENSIRVVKIFLNVSKDEQAKRFISRIDTPKKNWKFSSGDIDERAYWDDYMDAYQTAVNRTARKYSPWYVVPADHKWYARLVISRIVLDELKNMDPKWPVLDEEEMTKLGEYREALSKELGIGEVTEDETESGVKVKPADTAVAIALKGDREAVSKKKFRKQLEKSVFENFCERFGVSEETQETLGEIYLEMEKAEAEAVADDMNEIKAVYAFRKSLLAEELKGCGKEARKLYEHFKDAAHVQMNGFKSGVKTSYEHFEEELKQCMVEYELAVGAEGITPENAVSEYCAKVNAAYTAHREEVSVMRDAATAKLDEIADEYSEIGKAFRKEDVPAETAEEPLVDIAEETPAADADDDVGAIEAADVTDAAEEAETAADEENS
ncbi:MAG: hypothetical protein MJ192_07440 [Clostridia bacterium]|nr:hypothetical protein [Clostridia bacterium]